MFLFAYALVPLYNVLCDKFGINGKTNTVQVRKKAFVDKSRNITVQLKV